MPYRQKPGDALSHRLPVGIFDRLTSRLMLTRFRTADHEFATKELLIVQFLDGTVCLPHSPQLQQSETFRPLIVTVTYDLGVLYMANAVEQLEEITLRRVEGQVTDVEPR